MRSSFIVLYEAGGKRRLASDVCRSPTEERLAFEALKTNGLPTGIERAEYFDSDNPGGSLVLLRTAETPSADPQTPDPRPQTQNPDLKPKKTK